MSPTYRRVLALLIADAIWLEIKRTKCLTYGDLSRAVSVLLGGLP